MCKASIFCSKHFRKVLSTFHDAKSVDETMNEDWKTKSSVYKRGLKQSKHDHITYLKKKDSLRLLSETLNTTNNRFTIY